MKEYVKYKLLIKALESGENMRKDQDCRVNHSLIGSKIHTMQKAFDRIFKSDEIEIVVSRKKKVKTLVESNSAGNVELIF